MSIIDEYLAKYVAEKYDDKEYTRENYQVLYENIRMYLKSLRNGAFKLEAVVRPDTHAVCEMILIDDYENDRLAHKPWVELVNHFIKVIKSDTPAHKDFGLKDVPSIKLRKEIVSTVVKLNEKDPDNEFNLSTRKYEDIEVVIKTRLSFDNDNNRFFFDTSLREED